MIALNCPVKHYEWGKPGSESIVAKILKDQGQLVDEKLPYAELWMGTHQSGSAKIRDLGLEFDDQPLTKLFQVFPEFVGDINLYQKYGKDLPFLFKVLSIDKPLSIQVHPDKALAAQLNAKKPTIYPDANHKPEMAIALTEFFALCYFRPHSEIIAYLRQIPQLREVIGEGLCNEYQAAAKPNDQRECLKKCFTAMLQAPQEKISTNVKSLVADCEKQKNPDLTMFLWIARYYPEDVGTLAFFFLNLIKIKPGEAIYIDVNQPHAYIHGNCVEIMACSDNVIRAGLTPKFKDVELLCQCMTYEPKKPEEFILKPIKVNKYSSAYIPPVDEFAIEMIRIPATETKELVYNLEPKSSGSIFIVIEGKTTLVNECRQIKQSGIYFMPPGLTYKLSNIKGGLWLFRAFIKQ